MRTEVIEYIRSINLGGFTLTNELPRDESETALYLRNPKRLYVDVTNYSTEPLIQTLDGLNIDAETAEVTVRFSNDAKQLASGYDQLIAQLRAGKNSIQVVGNYRREVIVNTSFDADMLVTEVAYRFIKIT
jgi:hypothetical protein